MATTSYEFNLPIVGGDTNDWGGLLNENWEKVDRLLSGVDPLDGVDIDSGTAAFDELSVKTPTGNGLVPPGGIIAWSGAIADIPAGWALCNGSNGTPNLTNRFIVHADADSGGTFNVGDTGGTASITDVPSHSHNANTGSAGAHSHNASTNNTGDHSHNANTNNTGGHSHNVSGNTNTAGGHDHFTYGDSTNKSPGNQSCVTTLNANNNADQIGRTSSAGAHSHNVSGNTSNTGSHSHNVSVGTDGAHSHNVSVSGVGNHNHNVNVGSTGSSSVSVRNPYYALAYIMKL